MSESLPDLEAKLRLDTASLDQAVGHASKVGSFIGSAFGNLAADAIGSGLNAVTSFVGGAISAAQESAKIGKATDAIILATGGAAQVSSEHVSDLATSLSMATGVDDELIQSGENMVLTFKNIQNQGDGVNAIFDRTNSAALDLSAAGFGSVESASVMLGKALNDPAQGLTALGRAGVTFTEEQKKQVKALQDQGDLLGAQKVILSEVEHQVGGVAAATADPMARANVAIGNLQEQLGGYLLPILGRAADYLVGTVLPALSGMADGAMQVFDNLGSGGEAISGVLTPAFSTLSGIIGPLVSTVFNSLSDTWGELSDHAADLAPQLSQLGGLASAAGGLIGQALTPVLAVVGQIIGGLLLPAFSTLVGIFVGSVMPIFTLVAGIIVGTVLPAIVSLATWIGAQLSPLITQASMVFQTQIVPALQSFAAQVQGAIVAAQPFIGLMVEVISWLVRFIVSALVPVISKLLEWAGPVLGFVFGALGTLIGWIGNALGWIARVAPAIVGAISGFVQFAGGVASNIANAVGFVIALPGRIIGALGGLAGSLFNTAWSAFSQFVSGISSGAGGAIGFVAGLPGRLLGALGDLGSLLFNAGWSMLQGLASGIRSGISAAVGALTGGLDQLRNLIPHSPAKEGPFSGRGWTTYAGEAIMGGLAEGMDGSMGVAVDSAGRVMAATRAALTGGAGSTGLLVGAGVGVAATGPTGATAAGGAMPVPIVHVYIGDRELTELVDVRVDYGLDGLADTINRRANA